MRPIKIVFIVLMCLFCISIILLSILFIVQRKDHDEEKPRISRKLLVVLTALSIAEANAALIMFGILVSHINKDTLISINNENNEIIKDYDLGIFSPGETKEQKYTISSCYNKDLNCSLKFNRDGEKLGYEYFKVNISFNDETIENLKFSDCFTETYTFKNKLKEYAKEELVITYTLAKDIPSEIMNTSLDFKVVFQTSAFLHF